MPRGGKARTSMTTMARQAACGSLAVVVLVLVLAQVEDNDETVGGITRVKDKEADRGGNTCGVVVLAPVQVEDAQVEDAKDKDEVEYEDGCEDKGGNLPEQGMDEDESTSSSSSMQWCGRHTRATMKLTERGTATR